MTFDFVEADLATGELVQLELEEMVIGSQMAMSAIYRNDSPPGPAGRWLLERLKEGG